MQEARKMLREYFNTKDNDIAMATNGVLFEYNDEKTRANITKKYDKIVKDLVEKTNGVKEYLVVCDETNNTSEVIDNNEFVCDFHFKFDNESFVRYQLVCKKVDIDISEIMID